MQHADSSPPLRLFYKNTDPAATAGSVEAAPLQWHTFFDGYISAMHRDAPGSTFTGTDKQLFTGQPFRAAVADGGSTISMSCDIGMRDPATNSVPLERIEFDIDTKDIASPLLKSVQMRDGAELCLRTRQAPSGFNIDYMRIDIPETSAHRFFDASELPTIAQKSDEAAFVRAELELIGARFSRPSIPKFTKLRAAGTRFKKATKSVADKAKSGLSKGAGSARKSLGKLKPSALKQSAKTRWTKFKPRASAARRSIGARFTKIKTGAKAKYTQTKTAVKAQYAKTKAQRQRKQASKGLGKVAAKGKAEQVGAKAAAKPAAATATSSGAKPAAKTASTKPAAAQKATDTAKKTKAASKKASGQDQQQQQKGRVQVTGDSGVSSGGLAGAVSAAGAAGAGGFGGVGLGGVAMGGGNPYADAGGAPAGGGGAAQPMQSGAYFAPGSVQSSDTGLGYNTAASEKAPRRAQSDRIVLLPSNAKPSKPVLESYADQSDITPSVAKAAAATEEAAPGTEPEEEAEAAETEPVEDDIGDDRDHTEDSDDDSDANCEYTDDIFEIGDHSMMHDALTHYYEHHPELKVMCDINKQVKDSGHLTGKWSAVADEISNQMMKIGTCADVLKYFGVLDMEEAALSSDDEDSIADDVLMQTYPVHDDRSLATSTATTASASAATQPSGYDTRLHNDAIPGWEGVAAASMTARSQATSDLSDW